jgi:transaldolase
MKFFVDTADVAEIKDLAASGLLDGVTTNPSLIMKSGRPMLDVIKEICAIVPGPVSAETVATDHKKMLEEGRKLAKLAKNVAVKVPLTPDGLKTCKVLSSDGIMVNVTLCFSAAQALLAAKAGARCGTRDTWCAPPSSAPMSPPCRPTYCAGCSSTC